MKVDLIEQPTKNCDVCSAKTGPEDAFCQECGVSLSWDEPEPESFTAKIFQLQKKLSDQLAKIPSIPGMPRLPTAVPALIGLTLLAGVVTWCVQRIDSSFDNFSEDYISSAALKAFKKHNTTEAAELLLRFHLEHSGKMSGEHLLMLGQYLTMRADEAIQTKDYSTAVNYLKKVSKDCPQFASAQSKLQDLKERGLTVTALVQPSPSQNPAVVPLVVPQTIPRDKPIEMQESKSQTSVPIWQQFSHGVTTSKSRTNIGSGTGNVSSGGSGNAGSQTGSEGEASGGNQNSGEIDSSVSDGSVSSGSVNNGSISSRSVSSNSAGIESEVPKGSGFFIDGKPVTPDSRGQEPDKSSEKVTESARRAGPKSRSAEGQKSYNPDDISRYNELLANYFSQHDASSQKSSDKHVGGPEPPSFQEWISKGRPGFR